MNVQNKGTIVPMQVAATQTITSGGAAQTVFPAIRRHYLLVQNTATGVLMLTVDGSTPSATNGIALPQYAGYEANAAVPSGDIKVWSATTGATFHALQN